MYLLIIYSLFDDKVVDKGSFDFCMIECLDIHSALQLLANSRLKLQSMLSSKSLTKIETSSSRGDCDRGHYFVRILLHQREATYDAYQHGVGKISQVHIVDLVGSASVEDR